MNSVLTRKQLTQYQQQLEVVDNSEQKVRGKHLVKSCEEATTKAFSEHEQLYPFAD